MASRTQSRSNNTPGEAYRRGGRRGRPLALEALEDRRCLSLSIQFDYTYDTGGFFAAQSRRDLLDEAASVLESRIADSLSAITPSGSNQWSISFSHPGTGVLQEVSNPTVPFSTIRVYVGGRSIPGSTIAEGGPGGFNANGGAGWGPLVQGRGQAGALQTPATDFGPWGGAIAFDTDVNWFFGGESTVVPAGQTDFITVALHELGHVLGFGINASASFRRFVSGTTFTGPAATAQYDAGGAVPLAADQSHWLDGITDNSVETVMDPSISGGARKSYTQLDFAALADIGWVVQANIAPTLDTSGTPFLNAVNEDAISTVGTTVPQLLARGAGGNPIFDPDSVLLGIAVTGIDSTSGTWQFSTNGGGTWNALAGASVNAARLLAADGNSLVRFLPNSNFSGTVTAGLTFKAWDRTTGVAGNVVDTTASGGSTAFSTAQETASITVTAVADTPEVTNAFTLEDTQTTSGLVITRSPSDGAEVTHFKVFGIFGGTVWLSDGTTAVPEGGFVTAAQGASGLRFTPSDNSVLPGGLNVRSSTSASDSGLGDGPASATVFVTAVNDVPSFQMGSNLTILSDAAQTVTGWATAISSGPADEFWQALAFDVAAIEPGLFAVQPAIDEEGNLTFTPAPGTRATAVVAVQLRDGGGTAGGGVDVTASQTLTITIDTAPWQNPRDPLDVDDNGEVIPQDALIIINEINGVGSRELEAPGAGGPPPYYDVSGDGSISPLDALQIINFLNGVADESTTAQAPLPLVRSSSAAPAPAAAISTSWLPGPAEQQAAAAAPAVAAVSTAVTTARLPEAAAVDETAAEVQSLHRGAGELLTGFKVVNDQAVVDIAPAMSMGSGPGMREIMVHRSALRQSIGDPPTGRGVAPVGRRRDLFELVWRSWGRPTPLNLPDSLDAESLAAIAAARR